MLKRFKFKYMTSNRLLYQWGLCFPKAPKVFCTVLFVSNKLCYISIISATLLSRQWFQPIKKNISHPCLHINNAYLVFINLAESSHWKANTVIIYTVILFLNAKKLIRVNMGNCAKPCAVSDNMQHQQLCISFQIT